MKMNEKGGMPPFNMPRRPPSPLPSHAERTCTAEKAPSVLKTWRRESDCEAGRRSTASHVTMRCRRGSMMGVGRRRSLAFSAGYRAHLQRLDVRRHSPVRAAQDLAHLQQKQTQTTPRLRWPSSFPSPVERR